MAHAVIAPRVATSASGKAMMRHHRARLLK